MICLLYWGTTLRIANSLAPAILQQMTATRKMYLDCGSALRDRELRGMREGASTAGKQTPCLLTVAKLGNHSK